MAKNETGAIRVRAKAQGFLGCLREKGDEFNIPSEEAFASNWMERLEGKAATKDPDGPAGGGAHDFTVKHVPAGNWVVQDKEGNRASRVFKKDEGNAKGLAEAEAIRLNAGGEKVLDGPTGGGAKPTPENSGEDDGQDPTLPDA